MSGGVRRLVVSMEVRDRATQIVSETLQKVKSLEKGTHTAQLHAKDTASAVINKVNTALKQTDSVSSKATASIAKTDHAMSNAARSSSKLSNALSKANAEIKKVSAEMDKANKRFDHLSNLDGPLTGIAATTGATIGASILAAMEVGKYKTAVRNAAGDTADEWNTWIEKGFQSSEAGSALDRALVARKATMGTIDIPISSQENLKFIDLLMAETEKLAVPIGEVESAIEGLYTGSADTLNDVLGGFGVSNDTLNEMITEARAADASKWESYNDDQMMTVFAVQEYTKLLKERRKESGETADEEVADSERIKEALSNIGVLIGTVLLPVMGVMADGLSIAADIAAKFPNAMKVVAAGMALAFVAASVGLVTTMTLPGLTAMHGYAAGMGLASIASGALAVAQGVLTGAMTLVYAHPVGLVLFTLAAILIYVAKRTGVLSAAWEKLVGVWDRLKGADLSEIGKGIANIAFKMVFPPAALLALVKHIPAVNSILQRIEPVTTRIQEIVSKFSDKALSWLENMEFIKSIYDTVKNWVSDISGIISNAMNKIAELIYGLIPSWFKSENNALETVADAADKGYSGRGASARAYGIYRPSDDGYKISVFSPNENVSPEQVETMKERYGAGKNKAMLWSSLQQMTPEEQAMWSWQGQTSEVSPDDAAKYADLEGYRAFTKLVSDRATADEVQVAGVGANAELDRREDMTLAEQITGVPPEVSAAVEVLTTVIEHHEEIENNISESVSHSVAGATDNEALGEMSGEVTKQLIPTDLGDVIEVALKGSGYVPEKVVRGLITYVWNENEKQYNAYEQDDDDGGWVSKATGAVVDFKNWVWGGDDNSNEPEPTTTKTEPKTGSVEAEYAEIEAQQAQQNKPIEERIVPDQIYRTDDKELSGSQLLKEYNDGTFYLRDLAAYGVNIEGLDSGGSVLSDGLAIIHKGEEVMPAQVVHKTTETERLIGSLDGEGGSDPTNITNHNHFDIVIHGAPHMSKYELIDLIEDRIMRAQGAYRT